MAALCDNQGEIECHSINEMPSKILISEVENERLHHVPDAVISAFKDIKSQL